MSEAISQKFFFQWRLPVLRVLAIISARPFHGNNIAIPNLVALSFRDSFNDLQFISLQQEQGCRLRSD